MLHRAFVRRTSTYRAWLGMHLVLLVMILPACVSCVG